MTDDFGLTDEQRALICRILLTVEGHIEQVAVFGSRAQGRYRQNSDLDLVLYGFLNEAVHDRLWTLFYESPLPFSVDVVNYSTITHAPLQAHIDAVARPLFVRTEHGLLPCAEKTAKKLHNIS